jgi:hypothetical protein
MRQPDPSGLGCPKANQSAREAICVAAKGARLCSRFRKSWKGVVFVRKYLHSRFRSLICCEICPWSRVVKGFRTEHRTAKRITFQFYVLLYLSMKEFKIFIRWQGRSCFKYLMTQNASYMLGMKAEIGIYITLQFCQYCPRYPSSCSAAPTGMPDFLTLPLIVIVCSPSACHHFSICTCSSIVIAHLPPETSTVVLPLGKCHSGRCSSVGASSAVGASAERLSVNVQLRKSKPYDTMFPCTHIGAGRT